MVKRVSSKVLKIPTAEEYSKVYRKHGPHRGLRDVRVHLLYSTQQFRSNGCKRNTESWYDSVSGAVPD
jgi:hypothetical protein